MNFHRYCRAHFGVRAALVSGAVACGGHAPGSAAPREASAPADVAAELLAADRSFAAASGRTDGVGGLAAMFAADVVMPVPGAFAEGKAGVLDALGRDPDNATSRFGWGPIRGGASADGRQGFTLGYMTRRAPDGSVTPFKYLAYWVRGDEGWRVAAFNRRRRPAETPGTLMPPAVPARSVSPSADSTAIERYRRSLGDAERAFSDDAQRVGLRAAFVKYGSADAVNMGGRDHVEFVVGADSIAAVVAVGEPPTGSSVSWGPDRVIVASSGDLGVTIGTIVVNEPDSTGARAKFPFFTVWRRASPDQPWRYVAE